MSNVLIFFVLPVVTIILSIVLQRILKCPVLVAATFFAVFLILAFTVFDTTFLIIGIILTILAFIIATIAQLICRIKRKIRECCDYGDDDCDCGRERDNNSERRCDFNDWVCDVLGRSRNSCSCRRRRRNNEGEKGRCQNNNTANLNNASVLKEITTLSDNIECLNNLLTTRMNTSNSCNNLLVANSSNNCNNNTDCNCNCNNDNDTQNVILNAEFTPNSNNSGTTGSFRGCYRRRFF